MIIIACNTATIASIEQLQKDFSTPIIGVPDFGIQQAASETKDNKVGLLATQATVNSNYYQKGLQKLNEKIEVTACACPNFVLDVEKGDFNSEETINHIKEYTKDMLANDDDTIILGCTHFPFLKDSIQKVVGDDIHIIDPAYGTVEYVKSYLSKHNLLNENNASHKFFSSSDDNATLVELAQLITGSKVDVTKINIEQY
jgi:glutamate racemase